MAVPTKFITTWGTTGIKRTRDEAGRSIGFRKGDLKALPEDFNQVLFETQEKTNEIVDFLEQELFATTSAADSAIAAAESANSLRGSSVTSSLIEIAAGKIFATQVDKFFDVGHTLLIYSNADPTNFMLGNVTAYSAGSLTMNITINGGAGTFNDWNIALAGNAGPQGLTGDKGLIWLSAYNAGTEYNTDDAVFSSGSAYISVADGHTGQIPGVDAEWDLLASKGDQGIQGIQGIPGTSGGKSADTKGVIRTNVPNIQENVDVWENPEVFTANTGADTLSVGTDDLFDNGDRVQIETTGTAPAGLSIATDYFVVSITAVTLQLAATHGGAPIVITTAGTGVHTLYRPINGMSAGPVTIETGSTVTVKEGSTWVIL